MSPSRRTRRRLDRQRAKRGRERLQNSRSVPSRVGICVVGTLLIMAGLALLTHGDIATASRLGRVGGILIVVGIVVATLGVLGKF